MSESAARERVPRSHLAALWALSFLAAAILGSHGIAYWDAGDYTILAIDGGSSGLLLGRPLFLFISRIILRMGVDPSHAEVVLRWFWTALAALASPALAVLASRLGFGTAAARIAGVFMALSPSFAHAAHQVLTDGFALTLSIAALVLAVDRRAIASGVVLAAAILTRETAAVHIVAIVLLLRRQATLAVAACIASVIAVVFITAPPGLASWFTSMSGSSAAHPFLLRDLGIACLWLLAAGPIAIIAGAATFFWRPPRESSSPLDDARLRSVTLPAAIACVLILLYPDASFSPRYALAVAPIAFFMRAAPLFVKRISWVVAATALPLLIAFPIARGADAIAERGAMTSERVQHLPAKSLVVPGHFCPHARLGAKVAKRSDLEFVCPGWAWPADLSAVLNRALTDGRPVAVDRASDAWVGDRETQPRKEVSDWISGLQSTEVEGFTVVVR